VTLASSTTSAFAIIAEAIDRCESTEDHFRKALDRSRCEGSLSWELRAATSLARLLRHHGRHADAIVCLQPIYDRFTEGFGTADLIAAKQLLDGLSKAGRR
jgi:predicted ATPase